MATDSSLAVVTRCDFSEKHGRWVCSRCGRETPASGSKPPFAACRNMPVRKLNGCEFAVADDGEAKCGRCGVSAGVLTADQTASAVCGVPETLRITSTKPPPPGGVGTELKKLLGKIGIHPTKNCSCNTRAGIMDGNGIQWCERNVDVIVKWLREEAGERKLPFIDAVGRLLVKKAISNAKRLAKNALTKDATG